MIKVYSDRVLRFDRGEKDSKGHLISVVVKIGFSEVPEWVLDHDYFKLCAKDKLIHQVGSGSGSADENALKLQEQNRLLLDEIKALKEKQFESFEQQFEAPVVEEAKTKKPKAEKEAA